MTCKFCGTTLTEGERALGFDYCAGNPECVSKEDELFRQSRPAEEPPTHCCYCGKSIDPEIGHCGCIYNYGVI